MAIQCCRCAAAYMGLKRWVPACRDGILSATVIQIIGKHIGGKVLVYCLWYQNGFVPKCNDF